MSRLRETWLRSKDCTFAQLGPTIWLDAESGYMIGYVWMLSNESAGAHAGTCIVSGLSESDDLLVCIWQIVDTDSSDNGQA